MAFTHGDAAVYEDIVGIVDDPVHDRFGDRAAFRRSWINPFIPVIRSILGREDHRSFRVVDARLHDLQKIIGFLRFQWTDKPFIQDKEIQFQV